MQNVGFTVLLCLIGLYAFLIIFTAFLDLVTKFREVFPTDVQNPFMDDVYTPIGMDFDDGYLEDQSNYDDRITEMRDSLNAILKPEIITDEYEKSLE